MINNTTPSYEGVGKEDRITVDVVNLRYKPLSQVAQSIREVAVSNLPESANRFLENIFHSEVSAKIENVSFRADPRQLTAVLAKEPAERNTIMELLAGRRLYGEFDGDIFLHGLSRISDEKSSPSAFVSRSANEAYTPGLTYFEMLTYSARLRMSINESGGDARNRVYQRVMQMLDMMELIWCKDRLITERPTMRGSIGGELRRLSIAVELINLPPVLIFDDPISDLDALVAHKVVECLVKFTEKGHTVVSSFAKPPGQVFNQFHKVVLISQGRSIYASSVRDIPEYFTVSPLDYVMNEEVEVVDFLMDVADGVERPRAARYPIQPDVLQSKFESSRYFERTELGEDVYSVLPKESVSGYGYPQFLRDTWKRRLAGKTWIIFERAFYVKLKEYEVLKKSLKAGVGLGLFMGYFMWNMGQWGDYCLSLIGFPYNEVSTLAACLFIVAFILYGQQIINVHIICQKLNAFRNERAARCCPTLGFVLATILAEVIFVTFFALLFSNIVYWMSSLNSGLDNYVYIEGVHVLSAYLGLTTTFTFAAIIRREILVRDFFLITVMMMTLTSGFMFPIPLMRDDIIDISQVNPIRWVLEASLVWKFKDYPDGDRFLKMYEFQNFDKETIWPIFLHFFIFDFCLIFLAMIPRPVTLHRTVQGSRQKSVRDSTDRRYEERHSEPVKPQLFNRETSITAKRALTSHSSQQSKTDVNAEKAPERGPNVNFRRLSYRVPDRRSPLGYKTVLHPMTGQFDWGKLSVIMGAEGAGKSSLLHILGGQHVGTASNIGGQIFFDENLVDEQLLPWQRCAFVESLDEHLRDLSVKEVITYSMKLRCLDVASMKFVDANVQSALELLHLTDVCGTRTKLLTKGQLRRLTIAEEIVHGPNLIMLDEPITGLDERDASVIMTGAIRELVNQDRTVVATMHQPSAAVFGLCDTLLLLSKGRLVYMGKAQDAVSFFIESPTLQFDCHEYANPADFIYDVSGCLIQNVKGEYVDAPVLENFYKGSDHCERYETLSRAIPFLSNSIGSEVGNPVFAQQSVRTRKDSDGNVTMEGISEDVSSSTGNRLASLSVAQSVDEGSNSRRPQSQAGRCFGGMFLGLYLPFMSFWNSVKNMSISMQFVRMYILLERAFFTIMKREKMLIGTTVLHICMAISFCIVVGDAGPEANVVTPVAVFGCLMLILATLQYVFFLFNNHKVFLREHNRGLYSVLHNWLITDLPLLGIRSGQAMIYAVIVHQWIDFQDGEIAEYFYLMTWLSAMTATFLVETIVHILPDIRHAYSFIPGMSIMLFLFSGMIFKPDTLPNWMQPWLPSVSVIRWMAQGIVINEFGTNDDIFPVTPTGFSLWDNYLSIFGWGGKTKWYCLRIMLLNMGIYRVVHLLVSMFTVTVQKGKRGLRKNVTEDRMY
mmetsp:Transcript_20657/g.29655  ORF Transcript_20657/g.29655 Transcript_20657/m.29655 type:complete len:1397 (+) Transcript_20657:61-4251(+)